MMMRSSLFISVGVAAGLFGVAVPGLAFGGEDVADAAVVQALTASATIADARLVVSSVERGHGTCVATTTERVEVPRPVDGSGRFAVKLIGARASGQPC
jgi:hypothetical protein